MTKAWVWLITAAMVIASTAYAVIAASRAWILLVSKDPLQVALAVAIIVIPVIGLALIVRELWFGWRTRQMGQTLAAENTLPMYDGDLTPSGRPTKADADRNFERYAREAEDNSEDWRAWFRLAVAYDDARDRKRARAAMRQASNLYVRSLRS